MMPVRRDDRRPGRRLIGADQAQELADEVAGARQADAGHGEDHEQQGIAGHVVGKAAVAVDLARVQPVVDHADAQEERARHQAVAEHDHHRALDALPVHGEQAEGDERHVRDRRISDQLLHVALHQRDQAGVDDRDRRQDEHQRNELRRAVREHRQREADEAVAADLQQHAGEDHRARGRRLDVRVGQPGVDRPHRHLDREAGEEGEEQPGLRLAAGNRRPSAPGSTVVLRRRRPCRAWRSASAPSRARCRGRTCSSP